MAVAKLSRVALLCPRSELGVLLAQLCDFGKFHPSDRKGLVQDTQILIAASRYLAVYSEAKAILEQEKAPRPAEGGSEVFAAGDMVRFADVLWERLEELRVKLSESREAGERIQLQTQVWAAAGAAEVLFNDIRRIRVVPGTKRLVMLEGYVPTRLIGSFKLIVDEHLLSTEVLREQARGEPYIPTLLTNPRVISLFESTTLEQGVPRYTEIDPTPLVAFFFPFFFGFMFGDFGQGLVMLGFGYYLTAKWGERYRYWGRVLEVFGVASASFGLARGLFFGLELPSPVLGVIPRFGIGGIDLDTVVLMLEVSVVIGTFHLASAYTIALANELRSGNRASLMTRLPVLTLYSGLVPLAFAVAGNGISPFGILANQSATPVFKQLLGVEVSVSTIARVSLPIVLASVLALIFGQAVLTAVSRRTARGLARGLALGFVEVVAESFQFLVNTISYIRLGILMMVTSLSTSIVAQALAWGLVGVPFAVIGNVALMALEGFMVYIQDLRLQVYEWFSKFSFGMGTPFSPMISEGSGFKIAWSL